MKMIQYQIIKTAYRIKKIGLKQPRYERNRSVYNHRQEIIMQSDLMRQFWRSISFPSILLDVFSNIVFRKVYVIIFEMKYDTIFETEKNV